MAADVALHDHGRRACRSWCAIASFSRAMASSIGSTPERAKKQACMTVLIRPPRPAARATAEASMVAQVEVLGQHLLLDLHRQAVPDLVGVDAGS